MNAAESWKADDSEDHYSQPWWAALARRRWALLERALLRSDSSCSRALRQRLRAVEQIESIGDRAKVRASPEIDAESERRPKTAKRGDAQDEQWHPPERTEQTPCCKTGSQ